MSLEREIRQKIQELAHNQNKSERVYVCVVESVDLEAKTCDVVIADGSAILIPSVRLQAQPGNGILIVPKAPSLVVVTMINSTNGHVTMFSDVKSIQYFDGSFGGLIKIEELISKINNLESDLNTLKQIFTSWVPAAGDGGLVLKTAATTWASQLIVETKKTELENELVKHGE